MRLIIIGLSLALAASAPLAATAQAPVMTQPLAAGEVLLEVNALGFVTSRADRATMSFTITASGENDAAARNAAQQSIAEVRTMLRGHGVTDADIRIQPINTYEIETAMTADMNLAMDTNTTEAVEAAAAAPSTSANAQAEIVVRNIDRVAGIQSALMERGIFATTGINYALDDETVPRRQARAQAMQKARADAESYAASLNMRVVRIVRVTERLGLDVLSLAGSEYQTVSNLFMPAMMRGGGAQVPTFVAVGVDFVLAPR
jgi:uncharacterized protein